MSARMQFPLSQRRHTNIAVVRYAKNGVKLEIACYKNKVISYRSGTETRLDEVLQVERVFANVARGQLASEKEMEAVFGPDMTEQQAIKFMLDHGELQVAQQERTAEVDEMFKDVAVIISQKCVNTKTQHPFPSQVIEQALRSIGAAVKLDQPVKKQALSLIRALIEADIIPIGRANMKIRCTTTSEEALEKLRQWCQSNEAEVVEKDPAAAAAGSGASGVHSLLLIMQPNLFRDLDTFVKDELPSGSAIHMVDAAVTEIGDTDALLDPNAVSRANANAGGSAMMSAGGTPSTSSAPARGGAGAAGAGRDTDRASSLSNHHQSSGAGAGDRQGKRGGAKGKQKGRGVDHSSDESEESDDDRPSLAVRSQQHAEATPAGGVAADDLTAELQKLRVDDDSDDDGGRGGRGGKAKKNKKKNAAAGGAAQKPAPKKGSSAAPASDEDEDDDEAGGRKGKAKKSKRKKAAAAAPEKPEPEVEEAFDESDEELMVNRKQRAKKQQQGAQQDAQNWDDEEDFDYGEDEEENDA